MEKISTFEKTFIDDKGRERIFSGVNIVDKSVYAEGTQNYMDIDEALIKRMSESGFSIIRLGFTWAKLEPVPGMYNDRYLDSVGQIIDYCEKYNIYVFLDMHQDIYGPADGTYGDGAPSWATLTDGYKTKPTKFIWAESYFWGKACHRAFDNFWKNTEYNSRGLQDRYADCWKHVIKRIGDKPPVIGFDIMNEPFPGTDGGKCFRNIVKNTIKVAITDKNFKVGKMIKDVFSKDRVPKVLGQISFDLLHKVTSSCDELIHKFDTERYAPFMSKMAEQIRSVKSDGIIFMENCYYSNLGIPFTAPAIHVNGERIDNQVFAPHAYDLVVDTPMYRYASNERVGGIFGVHKESQDRLNLPVLVGEWGGFGDNYDGWVPHIEFLLNLFDSNKWSNTYWCYIPEFYESPLIKVFVRAYPKAVSGIIEKYNYDRMNRKFYLSFTQAEKDCGESIICVPFKVTKVEIDGKDEKIKQVGTEVFINTKHGKHDVVVTFE